MGLLLGCSPRAKVADPTGAAQAYLQALERGDARALRAMMTQSARQEYSEQELLALLERDAGEFEERRAALEGVEPKKSEATVFLEPSRRVRLTLEDGEFRVRSAGLVPPQPRTPEEAAEQLREAIRARSFESIEGVLTAEARKEFESSFERLESSLESLDTAIVEVREDRATIEFNDGRIILLRRSPEAVWLVESFQ